MAVNWGVVATFASPILALFVGAWFDRFIAARPRIISFLLHASAVTMRGMENPITVNTHSIVIKNPGRTTATNIRVGHIVLPDFHVYPDVHYETNDLPGGGKEILIPRLAPQKQITITYLYFPPLTWQQINTQTAVDDGAAKIVNVLPTVQPPAGVRYVLWFLVGYGLLALLYSLYALALWISGPSA